MSRRRRADPARPFGSAPEGVPVRIRPLLRAVIVTGLAALLGIGLTSSAWAGSVRPAANHTLSADSVFYVDRDSEAARQALTDLRHRDFTGALNMAKLASWPEA